MCPSERPRPAVRFALAALRVYKRHLSHRLNRTCRYEPSCSEYARLALLKYGFLRGLIKGFGGCPPVATGHVVLTLITREATSRIRLQSTAADDGAAEGAAIQASRRAAASRCMVSSTMPVPAAPVVPGADGGSP